MVPVATCHQDCSRVRLPTGYVTQAAGQCAASPLPSPSRERGSDQGGLWRALQARQPFGTSLSSLYATELSRWAASWSLTFSRSRSVTRRRNREFSSWSSAIRSSAPRMRSGSLVSAVAATSNRRPRGARRHRYKVITLTPSARAISLCNLPRVAHSFACASLLAISTLECLFLLIIVVSLRPYVATLQVAFDLLMLT